MTKVSKEDLKGIIGAATLLIADLDDKQTLEVFQKATNNRFYKTLGAEYSQVFKDVEELLIEVTDSLDGSSGMGALAVQNLHRTAVRLRSRFQELKTKVPPR